VRTHLASVVDRVRFTMNSQVHSQVDRGHITSRTDSLFAQLDGRYISTGLAMWSLRVLGIHTRGGEFWVQCAAPDGAAPGPLLRLSARATAQHALAALEAWAALPQLCRPDTVDVMRVAR
jgi:hypothetical protein